MVLAHDEHLGSQHHHSQIPAVRMAWTRTGVKYPESKTVHWQQLGLRVPVVKEGAVVAYRSTALSGNYNNTNALVN